MPSETIEQRSEEMISISRYHACPFCKKSLAGGPIPDYLIEAGFCGKTCHRCKAASHWSNAIIHHVMDGDKIVAINWMCPECGGVWGSGA